MTIHGGPLSYSRQTASENPVGIVPEGCILVIITPPQAVVFSSPTEDTETFRFFQQKNWIKTLLTGSPENCYGASKYIPPTIDEKNIPKDEAEELMAKEGKKWILAMMIVVATIVVVTIVVARMMVQNHTILNQTKKLH